MTTNRDSHEDKPCGCCEGVQAITPIAILNRPGQDALQYRLGTHGTFLKTMQARLSSSAFPALAGLTTRDSDDPAIALLDAWATVGDVLTFYQERIANEGYLRTAQEQRSIWELGRLVNEGDVLDAGQAASTYLAFELDPPAPGISPEVLIPKNTRAQTLPGQGELPQSFETTADLKARAEWNQLKPRMTKPIELTAETTEIYLKGTATNLKPNDPLLFVLSGTDRVMRRVKSVELQPAQDRTRVTLQHSLDFSAVQGFEPEVFSLRATASVFGHNAPLRPILNTQGAIIGHEEWSLTEPGKVFGDASARFTLNIPPKPVGTTVLKAAEDLSTGPKSEVEITVTVGEHSVTKSYQWPIKKTVIHVTDPQDNPVEKVIVNVEPRNNNVLRFQFENCNKLLRFPLGDIGVGRIVATASTAVQLKKTGDQGQVETGNHLHLNGVYPLIVPDTWVVIEKPTSEPSIIITKVQAVSETSRAVYGISGRCTRLELKEGEKWIESTDNFGVIRKAGVYTQSEKLDLVEAQDTTEITLYTDQGTTIALTSPCPYLEVGRLLIVTGKEKDTDKPEAEVVLLEQIEDEDGYSILYLKPMNSSESHTYQRDTVTIYANVVHALHGEAREEVLGSADASQPFQEFRLSHKPLSFIADSTTTGVRSTLEVFVNDLRWREVTRLNDFGPGDRVYVTTRNEEDNITVRFGDGRHGLRPPTGVNNVTARYRTGLGVAGNVNAWQINQLVTRPLGVKGVQNPLPASGGKNRDDIADARWNVPLPVMALDRVVSLQDCEDFALACTGIGKASATYMQDPQKVCLTVAGDEEDVTIDDNECEKLRVALNKHGDQHLTIEVIPCAPIILCLTANIAIKPDYLWEKVEQDVRMTMLEKLGFKRRALGQDAMLSEVISVIQSVAGVVYLDVDNFYGNLDGVSVPAYDEKVPAYGTEDRPGEPAQIAYFSTMSSLAFTLVV